MFALDLVNEVADARFDYAIETESAHFGRLDEQRFNFFDGGIVLVNMQRTNPLPAPVEEPVFVYVVIDEVAPNIRKLCSMWRFCSSLS